MPVMLSKTYDALISAGAPDDKAREAAEELANYENRLASIDNQLALMNGRLSTVEGKLGVITSGDRNQCRRNHRHFGRIIASLKNRETFQ